MSLTKNDMARVIVQALYALPALPDESHPKVVRQERCKMEVLKPRYKLAHKILTDSVAGGATGTNHSAFREHHKIPAEIALVAELESES